MKTKVNIAFLAVLCLVAGSAFGEPAQVNLSGATLFVDFFRSFASTNDHIDVDGDGIKGFDLWDLRTPDQLAPSNWRSPDAHWIVNYRGVGSGSGLRELVDYHRTTPGMELGNPSDLGLINRNIYYRFGVLGHGDPCNPGSSPVPIQNIDIAIMDVPTTWFVQSGELTSARWYSVPMADGYGKSPLRSWDSTQSNTLRTLVSTIDPNVVLNTNTSHPDENTVYDTELAWVPVAFIANAGTGIENITQKELQYLYVTGRMPSGENLAVATRDAGSGTRNAAMNCIGVDPSWGRGENVGPRSRDAMLAGTLGAAHQPANCGGSTIMEVVVQNNRLAVGYTGLMGGSRAAADAKAGLYEIINVQRTGGSQYVRPSIESVLINAGIDDGWQIGGSQTWATVGNPFAGEGEFGMDNQAAADYIRNIVISIDDFVDAPEDPNHNMPGEFMAQNYTLVAGLQALPGADPAVFEPNPHFNPAVHEYILRNNILDVPSYGSVNPAGKVPNRAQLTDGSTYSDGRNYLGTDDYYTDSSGAQVRAGANLSRRNRIAGDFNYDGKRDIDDIAAMMEALADPLAFEAGNNNRGDGYVIPEVIGDFNADGNFDAEDIRYWADGLAIDPVTGKLDRALGFSLVDAHCETGNFFGTTLATGVEYTAGASRADVAGSGRVFPGSKPVGADGVVDDKDIDYVRYILRGGLRADAFGEVLPPSTTVHEMRLDWNNIDDAVWMDLSCDMNGDLVIDASDVDMIVREILGTEYGDVNLDGVVDEADIAIIQANLCDITPGRGWADGDVNGDGYVTQADLDLALATMNRMQASQ